MVLLYVRKVELGSEEKGTAERADGVAVEVSVARVKGTTVQELRTAVAEKTKLKPEDLCEYCRREREREREREGGRRVKERRKHGRKENTSLQE